MAQAMLIQEAALKRLNQQVEQLQQQVSQLQSQPRSSGGFLAGLFGGGSQSSDTSSSAAAAPSRTPLGSQPILVQPTMLSPAIISRRRDMANQRQRPPELAVSWAVRCRRRPASPGDGDGQYADRTVPSEPSRGDRQYH